MFGNDLVAQCLTENRLIPSVVVRCIEAVEATAMEHEGIYRKSGGMGQTKLISSCFDRGDPFDLQDNDRFNDISAVTSV
jgi:Rac GTPase-activating protein 1